MAPITSLSRELSLDKPDCFKVINLGRMNQQKKEFMRFKYLQKRHKLLRRKENKQNLLNLPFIDEDEPQKPIAIKIARD
jgi:hypothetical protein